MSRPDDTSNLEARIYNLNDTQQQHERKLVELETIIEIVRAQLDSISSTMVTRELLNATFGTVVSKVESFHRENELKFDHMDTKLTSVHNDLAPIQKGIYWVVGLIIGTVILAIMGIIIMKPD